MSLVPVKHALQDDCTLSPKEESSRLAKWGNVTTKQPNCDQHIWVGIFFDGTNNNKRRDQEQVSTPSLRSHTNVVVLHDAFKDKPKEGYFRFYMPGVGTAFPEIGEMTESDDGKAMGWGGESRIYWAMIQVLNAMHRIVFADGNLVSTTQAGHDVKSLPLCDPGSTVMNLPGMDDYFKPLLATLKQKLKDHKPCLKQVNLSVFGFSRGAAQARAFLTFMNRLCEPSLMLAGVKLRFQFVGLFDTVASVGIADASGVFHGFGGYANGSMDIPETVERCTHYTAGHESREAFPLSSTRIHKLNNYRGNCEETVYPGCHSNVGGGYDPGCQGKSVNSRLTLLSQVPLRHMYKEARVYGVPLLSIQELMTSSEGLATSKDLQIDPNAAALFNAYIDWAKCSGSTVEDVMETHLAYYWRWRLLIAGDNIRKLKSYQAASEQDREDMAASSSDFSRGASAAGLKSSRNRADSRLIVQIEANSEKHTDYYPHLRAPPSAVFDFFDLMVHDSHASFYMVGPVTREDRKARIAAAREKQKNGSSMTEFEKKLTTATPDRFPLMTDFETGDIVGLDNFQTRMAYKAVGKGTRRESGGLIRFRRIFDDSRSLGQRS